MTYVNRHAIIFSLSLFFICADRCHGETAACTTTTTVDEQVVTLQKENSLLNLKLKELEKPSLSLERIRQKKIRRIQDIATDVKVQRQSAAEFEGFVKWMSTNLAGYNRYIQAGSHAAVLARFLPIPYAGQASIFTKFISQFTVSLNSASLALNNYLSSSQKFIAMVDGISSAPMPNESIITDTVQFADKQLIKDMQDAQSGLASVSDLSSGALSFLVALNQYVGGTDEYMNKLKGFIKKDVDPKEKSFLTESIGSLKAQADRFNTRLQSFGELGQKETAAIRSLAVYDELLAELVPPQQ